MDPVGYYTQGDNCSKGRKKFEDDITDWFVAESNASNSNLQNPFVRRCSPDWIAPWALDNQAECNINHTSFFVACAFNAESIMVKMKEGGSEYFLKKGKTYKFQAKVRAGIGQGSFQVVFSTKDKGLNVSTKNRWVAVDTYFDFSGCEWHNVETYFTVPDNNNHKFEEMKYIVLQYNNDFNNNDFVIHYDDIYLVEELPCVDHRKIQNLKYYNENRIVQANVKISAGAHVFQMEDPASTYNQNPVVVKSSAKVIYRAPTVYLEPGFFIEEPGSYFETQVGTCVENPCPTLPYYTPPVNLALCEPQKLGTELPDIPGIFYAWTPSQYFSSAWSKETDFVPPAGNGCIDAKLTIWSICGASQEYSFPVKYFDAAPQVSITNVTVAPANISFKVNFQNVQNYKVIVTNTNTNQVIYEEVVEQDCGSTDNYKVFILGACDFEMCGDKEIKIIADNACFSEVSASFNAIAPTVLSPILNVDNVQSSNYAYSFDVSVNANTEYVKIEFWNHNETVLQCTKIYKSCDMYGLSKIHWDNLMCQAGCLSVCDNHKIKISYKNICSNEILVETKDWIKTNTSIYVSDYPNVLTPNGDNINDALCFNVSGADNFHIVVVDRWGNTRFESSGCVTSNPVCVWSPSSDIPQDNYFYTITFTNDCDGEIINTSFVQIFTGFGAKSGESQNTNVREDSLITLGKEISIFPNPVDNYLYIKSDELIVESEITSMNGKTILKSTNDIRIDCSSLVTGTYFIEVKTENEIKKLQFVKL